MNKKLKKSGKNFVFQDYSGKRWPAVITVSVLTFICLAVLTVAIGVSLVRNPNVPPLELEGTQKVMPINKPLSNDENGGSVSKLSLDQPKTNTSLNKNETYGFYTTDDEVSKASLQNNIHSLGVVIPNWYYLLSPKTIHITSEKNIDELANKNHVKIMPSLYLRNDYDDDGILHKLLYSPSSRAEIINTLYQQIKEHHYAGINIDFRAIDPGDIKQLPVFMSELYQLFHKENLKVTLTVPPNSEDYDYAALGNVVDRMFVLLFDEHDEDSKPGPVASVKWTAETLKHLPIPAEKTIVCLGNFGYEWQVNSNQPGEYRDYSDIMEEAGSANLKTQWDPVSRNPYVRYTKDNKPYIAWFLDAATFYNQIKISLGERIKGIAIEDLGYEDPGIWKIIDHPAQMARNVQQLKTIENPNPILSMGSGEFIKITSTTQKGARNISVDANGFIYQEDYLKYPLPYYVKRYGSTTEKKVAITFDDGPDPVYTPKILDILSEKHVPATFFVIGKQAALYPYLLQREEREGHQIGNHTFTHANITKDTALGMQLEMNSTQRLIEQITGRSTTLFRPPFTTDAEYSLSDLMPLIRTQKMGYTMVGSMIDTRDWETRSSDLIVKRALEQLPEGNIILLHDSGGDRSATIAALPRIIDALREQGYQIVPAIELAGKTPADAMPPVKSASSTYMVFYKIADLLVIAFTKFCYFFFTVGIGFGILRMLFLLYFSYRNKQKDQKQQKTAGFTPFVSVVIPAYNEAKVIENTIHSILKSDYPEFEIVIVDDGSTDHTSDMVRKAFNHDSRVRLFTKANGGKSSAINKGCIESRGEILVILDADTSIARNTISLLVGHFTDEKVAAVSGNVRIGNVRNLLTLWQHVEYVTGFNLEKRAFNELNCITVVPGAIGAWRKSAIVAADYFKDDTLAEDTDITIQLLRQGYRITFEPKAYAYTEAPENLKSFIKQRFRWCFGILQSLWKHRMALFNPRQKVLGFIGLPNMISQYIFQTFAPLADFVFIIGLFGDTKKIITYYLAFLVLDLFVSIFAFKMEKVSTKPLLLLFIQRFLYRQFLTYAVWKSLTFAARGVLVGWNKLQRSGNVHVPVKNVEEGA